MSRQSNFALPASVLLLGLLSQSLDNSCHAQSHPLPGTSANHAIPRSLRPNKQPFASSHSAHKPVRAASATQHAAILAPTAMRVANEPTRLIDSQAAALDESSMRDAGDYGGCDACGGQVACCCAAPGFLFDWTRADLWAGTVGFTAPANFLNTASHSQGAIEGAFGFQEGINFGTRLPSLLSGQMGSQLGIRFIHSQLDGSAAGVDRRQQLFLTTGLFRRVDYGVQAGLVVDYLHDDWIYKADLLQLRGELSYMLSPCHELGFRFTDSQQIDDTSYRLRGSSTSTGIRITSLDTYRGFYRFRFGEQARGHAELQAGGTQDSGTLLGLTLHTPLQNQVGLTTSATYLIPASDALPSYASEGWNIGLALVWTPGRSFGLGRDYYRPLFEVADNGTLISKID